MLTKEEIICGTKEELIEYFQNTFKFIERSDENDAKGATYYTMPQDDLGSIASQINRLIKKDVGCVFFFKITPDLTNKNATLTIIRYWVFIRTPITNDA